jgi:hypothetical protein
MSPVWRDLEETHQVRISERTKAIRSRNMQPEPPSPQRKRFPWYLLTGLILGFILGLVYAWLIDPAVYPNTTPASMQESYKDAYRLTIAQVYAATGNLDRAQRRLALLEDNNPIFALGAQAQRQLANGYSDDARSLALLASALESGSSGSAPTSTPSAVPTQTLPVITPMP